MNQRKVLFLVAVVIVSLSLFSCQNSAVSNDNAVVSNNNVASNNNAPRPNETEKVLLEIYTDVQGMASPKGKYLDLRVYDSSRAECEYYPRTEKKQSDEQVQ